MDVNRWFEDYTGKNTELRNAVLAVTKLNVFLSKSEINERLPQSSRGFLDCERQWGLLDAAIDNLVRRDGLLEVASRGGVEAFRRVR